MLGRIKKWKNERAAKRLLAEARERMNNGGKHWTTGRMQGANKNGEPVFCAVGGIRAALFGKKGDVFDAEFEPTTSDTYDPDQMRADGYTEVEIERLKAAVISEREHAIYRLALQELVVEIRDRGYTRLQYGYDDETILSLDVPSLESLVIGWNDNQGDWDDVSDAFTAASR